MSRGAGPGDDVTGALRAALARTADAVPVPDLVQCVHARAGRIRRRRRAALSSGAAAALVVVGMLGVLRPGDHPGPAITVGPATSGAAPAAGSQRPSPGSVDQSPVEGSPGVTPPTTAAPRRTGTWGPGFRDDFSAPLPAKGRWSVYAGGGVQDWTTFTAANTTVHDGVLDLALTRPGPGQQLISGIGALGSAQRYGRWELRWRMTGGTTVSGGLVLVAPGNGRYPLGASIVPDEGALVVRDEINGASVTVPLDVTAYHRLALEWTPDHVRWLLDGRPVATWTDGLPDQTLWPALQTDDGLDCRPVPQPDVCVRQQLPQHVFVDWFQYSGYRP